VWEGVEYPLVDIGGVARHPMLDHLDEVVRLEALGLAVVAAGAEVLDGTARETAIFPHPESRGSSESGAFEKKRGRGTKEMTVPLGLRKREVLET